MRRAGPLVAVAGLLLAAAVAAAFVIVRPPSSDAHRVNLEPAARVDDGTNGGDPMVTMRTGGLPEQPVEDGDHGSAVDAALRFVASTDALMGHSVIGRREILAGLMAPESVTEYASGLERTVGEIEERLGRPVTDFVWVEAPLAATVEPSSPADVGVVRVAVWTVSVLAHPDAGLPQEAWRTVHVVLRPADDNGGDGTTGTSDGGTTRWLVVEASDEPGPTPAANELALPSGFDEFAAVAGWEPVVAGGGW